MDEFIRRMRSKCAELAEETRKEGGGNQMNQEESERSGNHKVL